MPREATELGPGRSADPTTRDVEAFEACRGSLLGLADRMRGVLGGGEAAVRGAGRRGGGRRVEVVPRRPSLSTVVPRLCLNELASARARREESRGDRLPEPVDWNETRLGPMERLEQISIAFLVLLQRLTPAERAVLLLHDVCHFDHAALAPRREEREPP